MSQPNQYQAGSGSDGGGKGDRYIDGLRYPRNNRQIDAMGFETTKHSLHFRGSDWDIPLTRRRDELTKFFVRGASEATGEPAENIMQLRFAVSDDGLHARFGVRHRAQRMAGEVQHALASYHWKPVKALYEPRERKSKQEALKKRQESIATLERSRPAGAAPAGNLSFFGRANVGPEGPIFRDAPDEDEEPAAYERQQEAKAKRTNSLLMVRVGFA